MHGDRATRSSTKCDIIPSPRVGLVKKKTYKENGLPENARIDLDYI